jgi:transcriptional regulator with XRE-family HTH domain
MSILGDNVKRIRIEKGLSQDELAQKVGYTSRSTISCIESGKRDCSQRQIVALADALGVSPGDLLEKSDASPDTVKAVRFVSASETEKKIIDMFVSLPADSQPRVIEKLKSISKKSSPVSMIARSSDDRPPGVMMLTPEQKKRLDEAPDETQNPDNDI